MRLGGQVADEQRVHRALQADMQLRDLALRQGHDPDTGEAKALVEGRYVLLVAAQAV